MSESESTHVPIRHKSGKARRSNGRRSARSTGAEHDASSEEADDALEGVAETLERGVETVAAKLGPRSRLARGIRRAYGATRRHPVRAVLAGLAVLFVTRLALVKRR